MAALFRIGMLFLAVFGMGFLFVNEVLNLGGKNNRLQKHLDKLRESLSQINKDLVPMDIEELNLLSMDRLKKRINRSSLKIIAGQFLSIYNEPSLAYTWLRYSSSKSILMISSSKNEFYYLLTGDQVKIYAKGQFLGQLEASGQVLSAQPEPKLVASLDSNREGKFQEIKNAEGKLLTSLNNPLIDSRSNQRVFHFIEKTINEDILLVKALAFLNLAQRSNIS